MNQRSFLFFFIALSSYFQGSAQENKSYDPDRQFSVAEQKSDIAILKESLIKTHPGLFWYYDKNKLEADFQQLSDSLKTNKSELAFYKTLIPIIARIHCSHTSIWVSESRGFNFFLAGKDHLRFLPLDFKVIGSRIFILKNWSEDSTIAPGTEVVSINGNMVPAIISELMKYAWVDGFRDSPEIIEANFLMNYSLVYGDTSSYQLELATNHGKVSRTRVKSIYGIEISEIDNNRYPRKEAELYTLKNLDSLNTSVLTIKEFSGKNYKSFLKNTFKDLKNKKPGNLIIDIRNNGGGEDYAGKLLYSYLALSDFKYYDRLEIAVNNPKDSIFRYIKKPGYIDWLFRLKLLEKRDNGKYQYKNILHENLSNKPFHPQKNAFKGNVFVLINNGSFSGSSEFSSTKHANHRAKFIGQETGGGYCGNSSGDEFILTLPHSGIRVYIPTIRYLGAFTDCPYGRGIKPDYLIAPSISDILNKKDAEMEFTLDLIRKLQKKSDKSN